MREATIDLASDARWTPELRRAVMRVRPEYFTWPSEKRERYGVNIPDADSTKLDRALQKELFGVVGADDALDDAQLTRLNAAILPLRGIGEDRFYLNEWLSDGVTLLDFETVYDYDHADHIFQEEHRHKENPDYAIKPYRGSLYLQWARLFVDDQFTYATLSTAAGFLFAELEEYGRDLIAKLIPHGYAPGKNHGKRKGHGYAWDMRLSADGKEGVLEELQDQFYAYQRNRYDALADAWDLGALGSVFIRERDIPGEANMDFVFSDKTALRAVRFCSFVRDCRAIKRPFDELNVHKQREKDNLEPYLRVEYERLLKSFDPTVTKLRKRRTIVIHEGAADKLF